MDSNNNLLDLWNNSDKQSIIQYNDVITNTYLKYTNIPEIKGGRVVETRSMSPIHPSYIHHLIILVHNTITSGNQNFQIYSLVVFDNDELLSPEKSRIIS